jgi:NAD+ diphosphatase
MITRHIAFSGQPLDRADPLRRDPAALQPWLEGDALLLGLDGLVPELDGEDRLCWRPIAEAQPGAELVFLGLKDGRGVFAAVPARGDPDPAFTRWESWNAIARLAPDELALYGGARSIVDWHARHRFCAQCGQPTVLAKGGWQRDCTACGTSHFPRFDPVAIMLVEHEAQAERRLLLGRQARFPARSYSALAGFVEPGETLEEAVAREVHEETGVRVDRVRYLGSQPWPFPSQLMLGCIGYAMDEHLTIDPAELEDARWFTREEVAEALAGGADSTSFVPPPKQAIAYDMLRWWLEESA